MTADFAVPQVEFAGVSKSYGGRVVLDGVDLCVAKGDFVTLIGPSGCGKSTVLKLISGLTATDSGTVRVDGMTPRNARQTISYIFQDATLLPWRTVGQNVGLGLELEGGAAKQRDEKTAALLDLVGLSHVAKAFPRELSGGMKMRVSIARALATSPRLLLMDEPFAALDAMTRNRLNEELLVLKEKQRWTTLFVAHSITEAVFLSDRVILMSANPGRVVREIAIPLAAPRTAELRSEPAFLSLVGQVSRALA